MSKTNQDNTQPIQPSSTEDTQPNHADGAWLKPVTAEGATIPVKTAVKRKPRAAASSLVLDADATVPVAPSPARKPRSVTSQAPTAEGATVPIKKRNQPTPKPATAQTAPASRNPKKSAVLSQPVFKDPAQTQPFAGSGEEPPVETEPPAGKMKRGKWIWLGLLGMLILILFGAGVGYASAIRARIIEQANQRLIAATTQFELGLVDQREGRLETAKKRYEYVLGIYPEFPGITDKLVEVGLALAESQGSAEVVPTQDPGQPEIIITPVATKDTTSVSILFNQAQNQLKAKDWPGLYTTLEKMRYIDPEYEAVKVDGMLYLALRNRGIAQIQAGHLEPGLYSFALASKIAPIDTDAAGYFDWASRYLKAASYGDVDEDNPVLHTYAVTQFSELHSLVPNLRDASGITVSQRYAQALVYLGDFYQRKGDYCSAVPNYQQAATIFSLPALAEKIPQAEEFCQNPPETPTPTPDPSAPTATPEQG